MITSKTLKFSIDKIEFIDEMNDMLFKKAKIRAFATGENAHTLPIDESVLRRGAKTIYNKPILWKYNKYLDDAMGHEEDEVPCGFIPEIFNNKKNVIEFEKDPDGRIFIVIVAYIWTKYSGKLLEIFKRDNNKKDVSIEIVILDSDDKYEKPKILDFIISGITILGEWVNPACKGCQAELLAFSEDKKQYEEMFLKKNKIKIDNSKDSCISGNWVNPRKKLFDPIYKSTNYKSLFNEAYLINNKYENSNMVDHKYPHHIIRGNKMVVHKDGLQAAFQRASQQGIVNGNIKNHLLRHYRELGLDTSNFVEFGFTKEQFEKYFSKYDFFKKESEGVKELNMKDKEKLLCSYFSNFTFPKDGKDVEKYSVEKVMEDSVICKDEEFGCKYEIKYSISEDEEVMADMDNMKKMGDVNLETGSQAEDLDKEEEEQDKKAKKYENKNTKKMSNAKSFEDCEDECEDEDECIEHMSFEELKDKYKKLTKKFEEVEKENKAYMSKVEKMSDYSELKKFKEDTELKQKKEAEMAEMNSVMSDIENRGVEMSDKEKEDLMKKVKEFSSIDAWANFAKAYVFDKVESVDGKLKIGMPFSNSRKNTGSIWDKI